MQKQISPVVTVVIILIVVVVLGAIGYFVFVRDKSSDSPDVAAPEKFMGAKMKEMVVPEGGGAGPGAPPGGR